MRTRFARLGGVFSAAKPPKKRISFEIADFYNRESRGGDARLSPHTKPVILEAPLGARTRFARIGGVFSAAEPPKKRILFKIADFCGRLIKVFYLFPFSPSDVFIYASRSKNENFCSKSVRPEGLSHLGITNKKRQKHCQKTVFLSFLFANLRKLRLKTCGFLAYYKTSF